MENLNLFAIILIIFGILQIALFFKFWKMTDNVSKLTEHFCDKGEHHTPKEISKEEREKAVIKVGGHLR